MECAVNRGNGGRQRHVDGGQGKFLRQQIRMVFAKAVNPDLAWKKQENISPSDKCVTFEMDRDAKDGRLGRANCQQQNRIVCEVFQPVTFPCKT
jgi:hypothetical protein